MTYRAPVRDMMFAIKELAGLEAVAKLPGFEEAGLDTAQAVLEESAKFNEGVLAPLNCEGDRHPSTFKDGEVTTTPGFKEAFRQFAEGGWQGLQHPVEFGGQGLPKTIGAACIEMLNSANLSFALCPLLTDGAIEALLTAGTPEQQQTFIPKMVDGAWTGTMNLTEPQAGSDLAAVRTRAEPQPDGTLQDLRHQDLHHLRRARHGGQHRPPGARARRRRARGREGHQPVHRAEVPGQCRRQPGRAQRRALRQHRAQARHQGQPDRGAAVRRPWRRHRHPDRRGEPRPGVHVHHDERGPLCRRRAGHRGGRARLPEGRGLCARPRAGAPGGRLAEDGRHDHPPPRRQAHADDDARADRRLARHGGGGRGGLRRGACAHRQGRTRAEPGLLRIPGAAGQGLLDRDEPGGHEPGRAGARRHGFHRGDRRRAVLPRRQDPDHLRRHDGDPGQRPDRAQDGARRRRRGQGHRRPDRGDRKGTGREATAWPAGPCTSA